MVWRKLTQEMLTKNSCGTLEHGGGGVMVWVFTSAAGVCNLCFVEEIWIGVCCSLELDNQNSSKTTILNTPPRFVKNGASIMLNSSFIAHPGLLIKSIEERNRRNRL
ncbi:hypothetical protein AVEN_193904-1 [Araneus ventricosus]|uniref:Uncharacterized protein n=1 Tax=Araneus ventricosus TaxID=182803 RepID=A0A4Y2UR91_ARAVE|nr:hypothetical protein AVEN_193904-1 [Araneus ventricosus]